MYSTMTRRWYVSDGAAPSEHGYASRDEQAMSRALRKLDIALDVPEQDVAYFSYDPIRIVNIEYDVIRRLRAKARARGEVPVLGRTLHDEEAKSVSSEATVSPESQEATKRSAPRFVVSVVIEALAILCFVFTGILTVVFVAAVVRYDMLVLVTSLCGSILFLVLGWAAWRSRTYI